MVFMTNVEKIEESDQDYDESDCVDLLCCCLVRNLNKLVFSQKDNVFIKSCINISTGCLKKYQFVAFFSEVLSH